MTRQSFMTLLAADIKTLVEADGGKFYVAENAQHPFAVLASGNVNKWVCILDYGGDREVGEELPGNLADMTATLYVGHCTDLRKDPGAWLYLDATAKNKALLARVDTIDAKLSTIVFQKELDGDDDAYARYGGAQAVTLPGTDIPLRAYRLAYTWTLRRQPQPSDYRYANA